MSVQTPDSFDTGTGHWWAQRLTAIALVPLALWFALALLGMNDFGHATVVSWMAETFNTVLLILLLIAALYHSHLGVQVILEDYVHVAGTRASSLLLSKLVHSALGIAGIVSIIVISGGAS
ncbi:MAG: succinate dehydrogenase, hydrophobic membrane anchor protein [Gammaproteobacteria bacterium]|jgi:succinate dehydrogenase / fumarate reductase membrane anchor subunit|nr:succinate dehydrogenase, hydrophobic membrane anchor protein [Gammaproteobacteria bacterium]MDP7270668.1 succinate dehydrogenase, hydrophobic membrane anchor protein [Gammaproteobacteria bacterium]HJP03688.1 succinate dehydrogenase, hydrophobic membrane anchor protein [Gammaproteobacteria bacterium]